MSGFDIQDSKLQCEFTAKKNSPAESKLRDGNGKENEVTHPATIKVLTNVTKRTRVQLTTLDQQEEGVEAQDSNQCHEQGRKQDSTVLERVGQEQDTTCNEAVMNNIVISKGSSYLWQMFYKK